MKLSNRILLIVVFSMIAVITNSQAAYAGCFARQQHKAHMYLWENYHRDYDSLVVEDDEKNKLLHPICGKSYVASASKTLKNRMFVTVRVINDSQVKNYVYWFTIHAYKTVLIAKERLRSHQILRAKYFQPMHVELSRLSENPIGSIHQINGYQIKHALQRGQVLTQENMIQQPSIHHGEKVTVNYQQGNLRIQNMAIAISNANIGEAVRIKNINNGRRMIATVKSMGEVFVK